MRYVEPEVRARVAAHVRAEIAQFHPVPQPTVSARDSVPMWLCVSVGALLALACIAAFVL